MSALALAKVGDDQLPPQKSLRGQRVSGKFSYSKFSNNCHRRQILRYPPLQPLRHHRRWLQSECAHGKRAPQNIFADHELLEDSVIRKFRITATTGKVTAEIAKAHAETEFEKYRIVQDRLFESDFDKLIKALPPAESDTMVAEINDEEMAPSLTAKPKKRPSEKSKNTKP